jgi:hypothetical protein
MPLKYSSLLVSKFRYGHFICVFFYCFIIAICYALTIFIPFGMECSYWAFHMLLYQSGHFH